MTDSEKQKQQDTDEKDRETGEPAEGTEDRDTGPSESRESGAVGEGEDDTDDDETTEPEEDPTQAPDEAHDRSRVEGGKGQGRRSNVQQRPRDQRGETDPKRRSSTT